MYPLGILEYLDLCNMYCTAVGLSYSKEIDTPSWSTIISLTCANNSVFNYSVSSSFIFNLFILEST